MYIYIYTLAPKSPSKGPPQGRVYTIWEHGFLGHCSKNSHYLSRKSSKPKSRLPKAESPKPDTLSAFRVWGFGFRAP